MEDEPCEHGRCHDFEIRQEGGGSRARKGDAGHKCYRAGGVEDYHEREKGNLSQPQRLAAESIPMAADPQSACEDDHRAACS